MEETISLKIDDALFSLINSKLEYLGYETLEDLVKDAFQLRVEALLQLAALSQSSP